MFGHSLNVPRVCYDAVRLRDNRKKEGRGAQGREKDTERERERERGREREEKTDMGLLGSLPEGGRATEDRHFSL